MWSLRVKTRYVSHGEPIVNEMYPNIVYALSSISFAGDVPNELGKIFAEIECNNLCKDAMRADPELEIIAEYEIPEEPEV